MKVKEIYLNFFVCQFKVKCHFGPDGDVSTEQIYTAFTFILNLPCEFEESGASGLHCLGKIRFPLCFISFIT